MAYVPAFTASPALLARLEAIAALRERIQSATVQVSWIPALQKDTRARNTHASTAIEGNPLTLPEVQALEKGETLATATERSRREVLNYFAGLRFIEKHQGKDRIAHDDLLKLHAIVATGGMDQGDPGRYRTFDVRVGGHRPPPHEHVSGLMRELLEWWNGPSKEWPAVISSGILHHRFEDIHPFADGNGRVGRLLALWELYRRGFDTHHIFSVDEIFWEDRPRYYAALDAPRKAGDLTPWLEFSAEAVHRTLERVWDRVRQFSARQGGARLVLRPRQERLLEMLRARGALSPREIWKGLGVSKQGALDLLNPLLKAGLVQRIGTRKTGKYRLA